MYLYISGWALDLSISSMTRKLQHEENNNFAWFWAKQVGNPVKH